MRADVRALQVVTSRLAAGDTVAQAVVAVAQDLAADPWDVVTCAGALARATWQPATEDVGLSRTWRMVRVDGDSAVVRVPQGALVPSFGRASRQRRGAFDTPADLARRLVRSTLAGASCPPRTGLDPACGPGALLLALREAGVGELHGHDIDPLAIAVARVALPGAMLSVADLFAGGEAAEVVVANPPYISPERQDKDLRRALRARMPWLSGRFDLSVPAADCVADRVVSGGCVGLVMPWGAFVERYGAPWRRRVLARDLILAWDGPTAFPGAGVKVGLLVTRRDGGPGEVADSGVDAARWMASPHAAFDPDLRAEDFELHDRILAESVPLSTLAHIDTGVVAHGPLGGKSRLVRDEHEPGCVPYADAGDFFAGRRRWLRYRPEEMHRPKHPEMFEAPKLVVQRITGARPVRVAVDRDGVYVGHTCTVVVPRDTSVPLERLCDLVADPAVRGWLRVARGGRLDVYPHDVGAMPVPKRWLNDASMAWAKALALSDTDVARLERLGPRGTSRG